jgi:hypothetical protein
MRLGNILNPVIGVTGLFALALSATIALAETSETIKIKVRTDDGLAETVSIDNLDVGATDVFVTESGREVLVTRGEELLTLELDGRTIEVSLPKVESLHEKDLEHHRIWVMDDGSGKHEIDSDVNVMVIDGETAFFGDHELLETDSENCEFGDDGSTKKCVVVKHVELSGDGTHEWTDSDGNHTIIVRDGDGTEVIDVQEILHQAGIDGDVEGENVIMIKKRVDVEIHEEHEEEDNQ